MSETFKSPSWRSPWVLAVTLFKHGKGMQPCWETLKRARELKPTICSKSNRWGRRNWEKEEMMWLEMREEPISLPGDSRFWGVAYKVAEYQKDH